MVKCSRLELMFTNLLTKCFRCFQKSVASDNLISSREIWTTVSSF